MGRVGGFRPFLIYMGVGSSFSEVYFSFFGLFVFLSFFLPLVSGGGGVFLRYILFHKEKQIKLVHNFYIYIYIPSF